MRGRHLILVTALWAAPAVASDTAPSIAHLKECPAKNVPLPGGMADVQSAVVRLETDAGGGSGFVISPDGFVVTAAHVVAGADSVRVVFPDGSETTGTTVRSNAATDLALLRLDVSGVSCIPLAGVRATAGSDLFVIGSPGGEALSHSVSKGVVSGYRVADGVVVLQTDAAINPGNSGGVALDTQGQALGVVSFKAVGKGLEGLGFAVASEEVLMQLHLALSDKSDTAIDVWSAPDASAESGGSRPTVKWAAAPPPLLDPKKACKAPWTEANEFDDAIREVWRGQTNPFEVARVNNEVTATYLLALTPVNIQQLGLTTLGDDGAPVSVAFDLKLLSGTMISFSAFGAVVIPGTAYSYPILSLRVPVGGEVGAAFASSRVAAARIAIGPRSVDLYLPGSVVKNMHKTFNCFGGALSWTR